VGHVARTSEMRNSYSILSGKPERRDHCKDLGVYGRNRGSSVIIATRLQAGRPWLD
jgi:hypothetical protein